MKLMILFLLSCSTLPNPRMEKICKLSCDYNVKSFEYIDNKYICVCYEKAK